MSNIKMAEGHHRVTPYVVVLGVEKQIEFLQKVLNAEVLFKIPRSEGVIAHAEVKIGDSIVMMGDATDQFKQCNAMLYVYVEDTDATYRLALDAGATSLMAPYEAEYAARTAGVKDPL